MSKKKKNKRKKSKSKARKTNQMTTGRKPKEGNQSANKSSNNAPKKSQTTPAKDKTNNKKALNLNSNDATKINEPKDTNKKQPSSSDSTSRAVNNQNKKAFPVRFPFWARLKIAKQRTALIIDETETLNINNNRTEENYVYREATHTYRKDYEEIKPNPDKTDKKTMYLKGPDKKPKRLFKPHNKDLDIPKYLKDKYDKNNK